MKRRILGVSLFSILLSISVFGAAVWVGSQYIETFQNGFKFGNANILKVSNEVPEFEDASGNVKRLDDKDKSTFAMFDAEDSVITGFTNITVTSVSPLSDLNSYSVSSFPATLPVVTLQERNKGEDGKTNAVLFQYRMTSGTAKAVVKDNLANIVAEVELSAKTASTPVVLDGFVGSALTTIQLEFQDVSSATGLVIDDIEFSDDPFVIKNLTEEHVVTYSGYTSRDGGNLVLFATEQENTDGGLITVTNSGQTRYTFNKAVSFTASVSYIGVNNSEISIELKNSGGSAILESRDSSATNGVTNVSMVHTAQAGDYLVVKSSQVPNNQLQNNFSVKAQVMSDKLITTTKNGFIEENILGSSVTTSGGSDIASLQFNNLIVGRRYFISGQIDYLVRSSNTVQFGLYSGAGATGTLYGRIADTDDSTSDMTREKAISISFIAKSTSVYFRFSNNGGTATLRGDGTKEQTFLQLHDYTGEFLSAIPKYLAPEDYDISSQLSGTGWTINNAFAVYRKTVNGSHWIDFTINGTRGSSTFDNNLVLAGVTPSYDQGVASVHGSAGTASSAYIDTTGKFFVSSTAATNIGWLSGSIKLDSKPTWAD